MIRIGCPGWLIHFRQICAVVTSNYLRDWYCTIRDSVQLHSNHSIFIPRFLFLFEPSSLSSQPELASPLPTEIPADGWRQDFLSSAKRVQIAYPSITSCSAPLLRGQLLHIHNSNSLEW